jgi:predicted nucleic acid binding AN1-type Zn finger protein
MQDSLSSESPATTETAETLRQRIQILEAEIAAMRPILFKVAEARMCRDMVTMIESCPFCTLKRGGEHGYGGKHDAKCLVTQARLLGF